MKKQRQIPGGDLTPYINMKETMKPLPACDLYYNYILLATKIIEQHKSILGRMEAYVDLVKVSTINNSSDIASQYAAKFIEQETYNIAKLYDLLTELISKTPILGRESTQTPALDACLHRIKSVVTSSGVYVYLPLLPAKTLFRVPFYIEALREELGSHSSELRQLPVCEENHITFLFAHKDGNLTNLRDNDNYNIKHVIDVICDATRMPDSCLSSSLLLNSVCDSSLDQGTYVIMEPAENGWKTQREATSFLSRIFHHKKE